MSAAYRAVDPSRNANPAKAARGVELLITVPHDDPNRGNEFTYATIPT